MCSIAPIGVQRYIKKSLYLILFRIRAMDFPGNCPNAPSSFWMYSKSIITCMAIMPVSQKELRWRRIWSISEFKIGYRSSEKSLIFSTPRTVQAKWFLTACVCNFEYWWPWGNELELIKCASNLGDLDSGTSCRYPEDRYIGTRQTWAGSQLRIWPWLGTNRLCSKPRLLHITSIILVQLNPGTAHGY